MNALEEARNLLEQVTPLSGDCGRHCGARCCRSMDGEETGMLLFPGEAGLMDGEGRILDTDGGPLFVCDGTCDRRKRPLSCRLFPLFPCVRDSRVSLEVDERARNVCPLCASGVQGMLPAFRERVMQCGQILLSDPEQRAFLEKQTGAMDELKELRRSFRAGRNGQ